jgi:hypothetical protein
VAWLGKRRKLPNPTAFPAIAKIKPIRVCQCSRFIPIKDLNFIAFSQPYIPLKANKPISIASKLDKNHNLTKTLFRAFYKTALKEF